MFEEFYSLERRERVQAQHSLDQTKLAALRSCSY
jgi:hypothetical protein